MMYDLGEYIAGDRRDGGAESTKLILGRLEHGDGGLTGLGLEVVVDAFFEVFDEGGAVFGRHAHGQKKIAESIGAALRAEGGEGADALLVHGEAAVAGVAGGLEL